MNLSKKIVEQTDIFLATPSIQKMLAKKSLSDISPSSLAGKKVLVRLDLNVPISNGEIKNDKLLKAALPTIQFLIYSGARVTLISHLGRPKADDRSDLFSLAPIARRLADLLSHEVKFASDTIGDEANKAVSALQNGEVVILENLRFDPREEIKDPEFSRSLANIGYAQFDLYIDDAFEPSHRASSSTVGITEYIPESVMGLLISTELKQVNQLFDRPKEGFIFILGIMLL